MRSIRDLAGIVPYDHIIVLINAGSYGGGGIFNHYSASTSDISLSPIVMVHEMGHGFAGLGDEYYTSDVAYGEFYKLEEEPWEPNLTTLVDFSLKWESMLEDSIPTPTPNTSDYVSTIGVYEGGGTGSLRAVLLRSHGPRKNPLVKGAPQNGLKKKRRIV